MSLLSFRSSPPSSLPTTAGFVNRSCCKRVEPPVFVEPLEDCSVDEGHDIKLHGVLTGSQPIKVSWLHNGEQSRAIYTHCCISVFVCGSNADPHRYSNRKFMNPSLFMFVYRMGMGLESHMWGLYLTTIAGSY